MLCESCKKNQANLHYTKIINGKIEETHLCEECAAKNYDLNFDNPFSMDKLFTGLIDNIQEDNKEETGLKCENCGLTYQDFKREGKFGCSNCYKTFKDNLHPLIKGLHGHNTHRGKTPNDSDEEINLKREEKDLKNKLEIAVEAERYEDAALLREQIKDLKDRLKSFKEG